MNTFTNMVEEADRFLTVVAPDGNAKLDDGSRQLSCASLERVPPPPLACLL